MRQEFIECKTRAAAKRRAPWAVAWAKVCCGWHAFESWHDYKVWKNQK